MSTDSKTHTPEQVTAWLRGLLSIALADNDFSAKERELFKDLRESQQVDAEEDLKPISPEELAVAFAGDSSLAQNFLRTAVMMAMVDGEYSDTEDALINRYATALGQEIKEMAELRARLASGPLGEEQEQDVLSSLKGWLDGLDVKDKRLARFLCRAIPSQCPFERDVVLFGRKLMHIPAMCKINPLYDQLVGLRFRSLSYLADDCGEDVSEFC